MNSKEEIVLGIDTSNYTTSAACITKSGQVVADARKLLTVKEGARGLRQSEALFQHIMNLHEIFQSLTEQAKEKGYESLQNYIAAVACSNRPRPVEGSYMPCFLPGLEFGKSMAQVLSVPCFAFSHQEGHIVALLPETTVSYETGFLVVHMSGGTCELLQVKDHNITILGGTKDITFGQMLDRIGVRLGMTFPCGQDLDSIAKEMPLLSKGSLLKKLYFREGWLQVSGMESAIQRSLTATEKNGNPEKDTAVSGYRRELIQEVFYHIASALITLVEWGMDKTNLQHTVLVGGVASSKTLAAYIDAYNQKEKKKRSGRKIEIPDGSLAKDNAIGIARLGGQQIWP